MRAGHGEKKDFCISCNRESVSSEKLNEHVTTGHTCEHCKFGMENKNDLKIHENGGHLGMSYPCNKCSYETSDRDCLRKHIMMEHENKKKKLRRKQRSQKDLDDIRRQNTKLKREDAIAVKKKIWEEKDQNVCWKGICWKKLVLEKRKLKRKSLRKRMKRRKDPGTGRRKEFLLRKE